jgi:hypothetical protein
MGVPPPVWSRKSRLVLRISNSHSGCRRPAPVPGSIGDDRATQYPVLEPRGRGVLDAPHARGMTTEAKRESSFSRHACVRVMLSNRPRKTEGAGNAGRWPHPWPACKKSSTRRSPQVQPRHPGIPRAMVLTVSFVLFPVTGLSCHRRPHGSSNPVNLAPASGRQNHTTSPSALRLRSSCATHASIASRSQRP